MIQVAIALGSNLGNRLGNILNATQLLFSLLNAKEIKLSSFYFSQPLTLPDYKQKVNAFVNAVLLAKVYQGPLELLAGLKKIERQVGRITRKDRWVEREVDLDILLFDNLIFNNRHLTIPHLEMLNRDFVLAPLSELLHDANHPITQQNFYYLNQLVRPKYITNVLRI